MNRSSPGIEQNGRRLIRARRAKFWHMLICLIVICVPLVVSKTTPATTPPTLASPIQPSKVIGGSDPGFFSDNPGVASDSQGNIYVADYYNRRIQKFDSQGNFLAQFTDCKDGNFYPLALAVNNTIHSLYAVTDQTSVADSCSPPAFPTYNVVQFDFNGTPIRRWVTCSPNGCPNQATSLALDTHGLVYVTTIWSGCGGCSPNTELFKFNQNGQLLQRIDLTPTTASYSYITALAVQRDHLYAASSNPSYVRGGICTPTTLTNCRIHELTLDGVPVAGLGNTTTTLQVEGLAVDAQGNAYASNITYSNIMRFASNGTQLSTIGGPGQSHGQFLSPSQIFLDAKGLFYVADQGNDRIQIFDKNWNFLISFGRTTLHQITNTNLPEYGSATGVYIADSPPGIAMRISKLDPDGNLLLRFDVDNYIPYTYAYTPWSIAVNPTNGTIYVAYTEPGLTGCQYSEIFAIKPNPFTKLGNPRMGYGCAGIPSVTVDNQGFVYGWSGSDEVVHKYNSNLTSEILPNWFPYPPDSNYNGGAIAVDSVGNIYLTNGYHNRISIYTNTGAFLSTLTPPAGAGNTIALDKTDNIFLPSANINNITLLKRTPRNTLEQVSSFNTTYRTIGIAVDQQGTIYSGEILSGAGGAVSPIYEYQSQALDAAPTVSVTLDKSTAYRGDTITMTISAVDPDGTVATIRVAWGDGTIDRLTGSATTDSHSFAQLGTFKIIANATDETNQVGTVSSAVAIIDKPPTATLTSVSPSPATTDSKVTVTFSANDPDGTVSSVSVNWGDGTSTDTLTGTATSDTHTYTTPGTFKINVTATDNDGSVSAPASALLTVQSPAQSPTVTITSQNPNPASTNQMVEVRFTISSSATVTSLTANWGDGKVDQLALIATSATHVYSSTGDTKSQAFTIKVTATNSAGPGSATSTETVNDQPPTSTILNVTPSPATTNSHVTITFSSNDPDGTVSSISVDWGDGTSVDHLTATPTSDMHTYTTAGSFTISVTALDNSGQYSTPATTLLIVQSPPQPAQININSVTPNPADTGATVTLTFTISSTTTITTIVVNWGDGSSADTLPASAISDTHIFTSTNGLKSKAFTITVSATNTAGTGNGQTTQSINDRPPNVTINSVTPNPTTGQTITLGFHTTDPDGSVSSIRVDWGDSSAPDTVANTASSGSHSYSFMGRYTITVKIVDDSGNSGSVSSAIAVSQPPAQVKCGEDDTCTVRTNSTITNADADRNRLRLTATGNSGTTGFANVTIPRKDVPNINKLRITLDGAQLAKGAATITSDSTDYFVYFTFTFHSPVVIIIEFNPTTNTILGIDPTLFYTIPASVTIVALGVVGGLLRRRRRRAGSN